MDDYLREELEAFLPSTEVEALLARIQARAQIDRELSALDLDRTHYHEALDRVFVAMAYLEQQVGEHPVFTRHPELAAMLGGATESLAELYQAIGRMPLLSGDP